MSLKSPIYSEITIVIVTFNSAAHIRVCLNSILGSNYTKSIQVIVVDNASNDATVDIIMHEYPLIELVQNKLNKGFAVGCNQGLERSNSNYSLLLNPDAALYEDTLTELIDYMERHPRVGIVGPGLFDENGDLQRDCSATGIAPGFGQAMFEYTRLGRYFPNHRLIKQYFQTQEQRKKQQSVAMVQGACFLFRRTLFEQIGQFDENYFLYFEETDYCQRALGQDWQVHYLGNQSCQHSGAHSMPQGQQASWYFIRSLYRYHSKHTGRFKTIMLWLILMPYHLLKVIRMSCFQVAQPNNIVLRKDLQVARERFLCHFWFLTQAPHLR